MQCLCSLSGDEKKGFIGLHIECSIVLFSVVANIVDMPLHGMRFTWSNNMVVEAWARLDPFLISLTILMWFPNLRQSGLPRSLSDHNLVMIGESGNKALDPDGFNLNFIKAHWDAINGDFMNFMNEFYKDGYVVKDINRAFIALIPKVGNLVTMTDFRPIFLVGSFYKILAKVLANRLRKVMDVITGETKMTFVSNRQISDSLVIAEEIIQKWRSDKEGGLIMKLDFENSYDNIDRDFLDTMMGWGGVG
ncbi:hypothetical protein Dsin_024403 [Dipteronia sinensis]|uniref:Reverse transcriptase domain-containing protein n=1 Tax=Dipteronia sinensis TaxID=43782 RepID=A0AAD9ZVE7_9ROSI|nr:hypothetical protein Dsin_024403 [Dipteronia sinensis]